MTSKAGSTQQVQVRVLPLDVMSMTVKAVGDTPLISHRFSDAAMKKIIDKQTKETRTAKAGRPPKDFDAEFHGCLYPYGNKPGHWGIKAIAFKLCAATAAKDVPGLFKTTAMRAFHVSGTEDAEFCELVGKPEKRVDMVRLESGVSDVRVRAEFWPWSATMKIVFSPDMLTAEEIVNLLNRGGFSVGAGDWRPEKGGNHGRFHVEV